jgi:hypothetical protein
MKNFVKLKEFLNIFDNKINCQVVSDDFHPVERLILAYVT